MINNVVINKQPNISWIHPINIKNCINANNFNSDYLDTLNKLRNSSFKFLELRDIANKISDGPFGSQLKVEEYKEEGFPIYRVKNVFNTQILDADIVYIDDKKQQQLKRSEVLPGDVLITKAGRIGSAAVVPSELGNGNITSHLVLVRLKRFVYNYYLVAYLECKYGKIITSRESYKSTRPELTKNEIENVIIPIPSSEIQKYIGDKVRKAEELREEAKKAKIEFENNFLRVIGIKEEILFPEEKYRWVSKNELQTTSMMSEYYKNKYLIIERLLSKKGLRVEDIKKASSFIDEGSTPASKHPKKYYDEGQLFIRGGDIQRNLIEFDKVARITIDDYKRLPKGPFFGGDVLLTMRGNYGFSAVVPENVSEFKVNPTIAVIRPKDYINAYYLAAYLNSVLCRVQMDRLGQTSTRPQLNLSEVKTIKVVIPSKEIQIEVECIVKDYILKDEKANQLIQEAKQDVEDLIEGNFDITKIMAKI